MSHREEETTRVQRGSNETVNKVLAFLILFMCETLAKRIISIVLIAVGLTNDQVTEYTRLCNKSVRVLRKAIESGDIIGLFTMGSGGRKRKLEGVEEDIITEIDKGSYSTRQEIVDMIQEKYGIKVSLPVVGRLLKKGALNV
jgi:transposase